MQLCRVRKNFRYIDCTYRQEYCTWFVNSDYEPWVSHEKLDDEYLVSIPAQLSTPSMS